MDTQINNKKNLIIIDTDCGTDDAMAIILAFSSRESEVLAITCCSGNTTVHNAAQNVKKVLVVCNKEKIPIYRGCSKSLLGRDRPPGWHGSDGLGDCEEKFPTGGIKESEDSAIIALTELTKRYPNQITLVALAPLTNIAMAHRIDDEFTSRLKSIVCMGGNCKGIGNVTETAEFNFYCDPESAHIIITEADCPVFLIPWETTIEHGIEWDYYMELMQTNSRKAHFLKSITALGAQKCREENENFIDCDLIAMAVALYPDCIKCTIKRPVLVECSGNHSRGLCICLRDFYCNGLENRKIEIVVSLDIPFLNQLRRQMLKD